MKILGLDSSGLVASVAIVEDNDLKGEYTVNYKKTHSQTLLPMLDEVAKMIELDLNSIDAIAVSGGPGHRHRRDDAAAILAQNRDNALHGCTFHPFLVVPILPDSPAGDDVRCA